jgi:hypothetical protein
MTHSNGVGRVAQPDMLGMHQKRVLVTGGASGIGQATARVLAQMSWSTVSRRNLFHRPSSRPSPSVRMNWPLADAESRTSWAGRSRSFVRRRCRISPALSSNYATPTKPRCWVSHKLDRPRHDAFESNWKEDGGQQKWLPIPGIYPSLVRRSQIMDDYSRTFKNRKDVFAREVPIAPRISTA